MPDIAVWNKCDNRCVMCTNMDGFSSQPAARYGLKCQIEKLERYLSGSSQVYLKNPDKAGFISLTGGEPTLHPEFLKLVSYFRRRLPGIPITLLSNGRAFADPDFTGRFLAVARPPFSVGVPLHAGSAARHDRIAGVRGAFRGALAGLRNLFSLRRGQELEIRVVLHRMSVSGLRGLLAALLREFPDTGLYRVVLIHYELEGMSLANDRRLSLRLTDSAAVLAGLRPLLLRFRRLELYHFPRCVLPSGLRELCRVTLPAGDRHYPAACRGCALRRGCAGLMKEYAAAYGTGELRRVVRR